MSSNVWSTVMRAWHHGNGTSGVVIRMINHFNGHTRQRSFASTDEAVSQLRDWLHELEDSPPDRVPQDDDTTSD